MWSFRPSARSAVRAFAAALAAGVLSSASAEAQQQAQGFGVERLYQSAPGGGWFVMDDLSMRGGLGGVMALSTGYAHDPLRISSTDGAQHLNVVSDQTFADLGFAATYDRWRLYLNFSMPLLVQGESGTVGAYQFTAPTVPGYGSPNVTPSSGPDIISDLRLGFDARVLGEPKGPFRLGVGAQLFIPSANEDPSEYVTDGTLRAMGRILAAGDVGPFTYAGQVGVHIRQRDDTPTPGSPQGSELLFGAAAGAKVHVSGSTALVIGPEIYGASAFRSLFRSTGTALEGLLTTRVEGTADDGPQVRVKLGVGGGIDARFGAPEWRLVLGIELFDHSSDRDRDGVTDSKDACPDTPGIRTKAPTTDGCPALPGDTGAPSR
jgi:OOP family OmpA-OmpF porin